MFVGFVANMYTFGCFCALTGLIIARLKEPSSDIHMTANQESWFGKLQKNLYRQCDNVL